MMRPSRTGLRIDPRFGLYCCWALFLGSVLLRVVYLFENPPMGNIFSDPARHWENGKTFLHPSFMSSMDPKIYQGYIYLLRRWTQDDYFLVSCVTALMSALLPLFWLLALRELLPVRWALIGAAAIGFSPSLLLIYSYFMMETLLLTLCGASIWLSLRALRLRSLGAFVWPALLWTLSCYTRTMAIPMAGVFIGALCLIHWPDWKRMAVRAALFAALMGALLPMACWHSGAVLRYCAPFGSPYINAIHNAALTNTISMHILGHGDYGFGICSIYNRQLAPFSDWKTRESGDFEITVDPARGEADWKTNLALARGREGKVYTPIERYGVNFIKVFLDASWPDNNASMRMARLTIHSRWMWLPLTVAIIVMGWRYRRMPWRRQLIPGLAVLLMAMLLTQQRYSTEGRYRKAFEPLLIAGFVILLHERGVRRRADPLSKEQAV